MWRIRRFAILPVFALLITAMAAISMPLANAGTPPDPGRPACALDHNGLLRYFAVPAECGHQGKSAAPSQHKPPVLGDIESSALRYAAGAPPVRVTPSLTVTSPATGTLAGATVTVSSGLAAGQDALAFTGQSGITGSYSASTGVLTFTGTATVSAYAAELRSVAYRDADAATPYGTQDDQLPGQRRGARPQPQQRGVPDRPVTAKPPVAAGDKAATGKNAPVTVNVLANDTDPAGLPLTIASVNTTGTKGTRHHQPWRDDGHLQPERPVRRAWQRARPRPTSSPTRPPTAPRRPAPRPSPSRSPGPAPPPAADVTAHG